MKQPVRRVWEGMTRAASDTLERAQARQAVIDSAKAGEWPRLLKLLRAQPDLVNTFRPDGHALYAPLHHAAYNGAPEAVVQKLLRLGAWRTLRTADGERAVDIARRRRKAHLRAWLEPAYQREVEPEALQAMQRHFHQVILTWRQLDNGRRQPVRALVEKHRLRLPELEILREFKKAPVWFQVPGMAGGFSFQLEDDGCYAYLLVDSWNRIVGGPLRHFVSAHGSLLLGEVDW